MFKVNMLSLTVAAFLIHHVGASLWPQGVVHFAINKKDYDIHSQDVITSTLAKIQNEICVKFFITPANFSAGPQSKVLFISNPGKRKDCPPISYDFTESIVDMPIGYRCINEKDIARIVVEMLKSSIEQSTSQYNSYDLVKRFQEQEETVTQPTLLSPADRNYLNGHYYTECGSLLQNGLPPASRRFAEEIGSLQLTDENREYYDGKVWPLAVVMYAVHPNIAPLDPDLLIVKRAMAVIELSTCVVFQRIASEDVLEPVNLLWLGLEGEDLPNLGFMAGNQTLNLRSVAKGVPGHEAHALAALLRALGVPMMSNRYDRDNYISVNWRNIAPGKEHYLERAPKEAWLEQMPYDFYSATHAPANFMCRDCASPLASRTVVPMQDHLWQRTLSMGRRHDLSESDAKLIDILYAQQCRNRFLRDL